MNRAAHSRQTQSAQRRAQQQQERTLRARENRELRRLPAAQRTQRRQEIQRTRQQRAQEQREQRQNALTSDAVQRNAARGPRRNGRPRVALNAARQGRFAARFAQQRLNQTDRRHRFERIAARRAWHRGHRAAFVAWYGPVFWPYAYSDIFDYAFWPRGYEDGYWSYAYDDFFDGVFWGEAGPPAAYAYAAPKTAAARPTYKAVQNLCKQPGSGITAWPFAEIDKKVVLDAEQKQLLGDVRDAAKKAADGFAASCPSDNAFPLTPPGRLQVMTARLDATLQAVETVRPPLEKFYNALSDEQKERFNRLGPGTRVNTEAAAALPDKAETCGEAKPGLTNLPIEQVEDAVEPTEAQQADLDRLGEATVKAVGILQAACPESTPITPPGRLEAMEKRLRAMLDAAEAVKPPLTRFYGALTNEQKARFNRLGGELASQQ